MQPNATDGTWSVCMFVCLSVSDGRVVQRTAEPIETPFGG